MRHTRKDRPTFVLLHGLAGSTASWDEVNASCIAFFSGKMKCRIQRVTQTTNRKFLSKKYELPPCPPLFDADQRASGRVTNWINVAGILNALSVSRSLADNANECWRPCDCCVHAAGQIYHNPFPSPP